MISSRGIMNIFYGTTSGNSSQCAFNLAHEAREKGFHPRVIHLGDFDPEVLKGSKLAIFTVATYG